MIKRHTGNLRAVLAIPSACEVAAGVPDGDFAGHFRAMNVEDRIRLQETELVAIQSLTTNSGLIKKPKQQRVLQSHRHELVRTLRVPPHGVDLNSLAGNPFRSNALPAHRLVMQQVAPHS